MRLVAQHTLERKDYLFQLALYSTSDEKRYTLVRCWGTKIIFYTGTLTNHGRHQPVAIDGSSDLIAHYNRILRKQQRAGYSIAETPRFLLKHNPTAKSAFVQTKTLLKKDPYGKFINLGMPAKAIATVSEF